MEIKKIWYKLIKSPKSDRFIEIDMFRGFALILMIVGHILWDLDYFGLIPINNSIYSALQKIVPPLFFILVGMSIIVSKKRIEKLPITEQNRYYKKLVIRGLKIFSLGMIITIGTLLFIPEKVVFFGVLHCIGLSIILCVPFLKYQRYNILISIAIIFAGSLITQHQIQIENPTLPHLIIGFHQTDLWKYTLDYFPLIPWFGVTLLGLVIGDWLYLGNERRFKMPDLSRYKSIKIFQWIGQHSLGLYLLHQPIIAGAITILIMI